MDESKVMGLLMLATGIADVVLARRMAGLSNAARTMLYVLGGGFLALGATLLIGNHKPA